ncbi:hypothetical protein HYT25_03490 [Candidatus Pacearchaeota archaeon]|nr:hypothetical protein [Candidatus Pacearchaeota archaeon]
MKNKKKLAVLGILILGIFLVVIIQNNLTRAVGEPTYCCEKTKAGAWCQNVPDISQCDTSGNFRSVPTSCEATSYCKLGTCVNTQEGVCMENTPQRVCEQPVGGIAGGLWFSSKVGEIPQCRLGCCLIGEQAAFTTQTRCEQLSSLYGLEINYRTDISSETSCIASAFPKTKGACVFEEEFQKSCRFVTREECNTLQTQEQNVEFHEGFLCSSEELGTICGPSEKTTIFEGKDEIYFLDTCGNQGNIYDASRQNDRQYWDKIIGKAESCGFGNPNGNAQNPACGNCDYLSGSTGALYDRLKDGTNARPIFGDYVCRNLNCRFEADLNNDGDTSDDLENEQFQHGESWCAQSAGVSQIISEDGFISGTPNSSKENIPGSRYFRMVCYNGDVTIEPCADFRQEICIQSEIETNSGIFRNSACRVNKWQDCIAQERQEDCENFEQRDCKWIEGYSILKDEKGKEKELQNNESENVKASCVPKYSPGFNFWDETGDANALCVQASKTCTVKVNKNIAGVIQGRSISDICDDNQLKQDVEGCNCLKDSWLGEANNLCIQFGDCGVSKNYMGDEGFNELDDLFNREKE